MKLFNPRRRADGPEPAPTLVTPTGNPPEGPFEPVPAQLPDPAMPPQARGTWEHAALVNVGVTELVKQQIGAGTPPWKK